MSVQKIEVRVSTSGTAGSASGSGSAAVAVGELVAVHVNYHASAPATTDVTIKATGNPADQTALTLTNVNTDAWYYPRRVAEGNTGAALTTHAPYVVHGGILNVDVAQADALTDCVIATFYVRT